MHHRLAAGELHTTAGAQLPARPIAADTPAAEDQVAERVDEHPASVPDRAGPPLPSRRFPVDNAVRETASRHLDTHTAGVPAVGGHNCRGWE